MLRAYRHCRICSDRMLRPRQRTGASQQSCFRLLRTRCGCDCANSQDRLLRPEHFQTILLLNLHTMTESNKPLNVLFLCTHNSARSILAEALLNAMGNGRFRAYSAGSSPRETQKPNPLGLQVLEKAGISIEGLRSKSWYEFAAPDAPSMDLIITVCDNAAGEVCPIWPGHPATAHWGYADPSEGDGTDDQKLEAFRKTLHLMKRRLELLINLPADKLVKALLQTTARELAKE